MVLNRMPFLKLAHKLDLQFFPVQSTRVTGFGMFHFMTNSVSNIHQPLANQSSEHLLPSLQSSTKPIQTNCSNEGG